MLTNLGELGLGGEIAARIAKFYIPALLLRAIHAKPEPVAGLGEKLLSVLRAEIKKNSKQHPLRRSFSVHF